MLPPIPEPTPGEKNFELKQHLRDIELRLAEVELTLVQTSGRPTTPHSPESLKNQSIDTRKPEWSNSYIAEEDPTPLGTIEKRGKLVRIKAARGYDTLLRTRESISKWFEDHKLDVPELDSYLTDDE